MKVDCEVQYTHPRNCASGTPSDPQQRDDVPVHGNFENQQGRPRPGHTDQSSPGKPGMAVQSSNTRQRAPARGAIYARYSTKGQDSDRDQVRELLEWAIRNDVVVPDHLIFVDKAQSGTKRRRPAFLAMERALEADQFDVLLAYRTNRLFRKTYGALKFVNEEVVDRGKRVVFVSNNIDTADKQAWKTQLSMHTVVDELSNQSTADQIRAGVKGRMLAGEAYGTVGYGYRHRTTDEVGHRRKPRKVIVIDEQEAQQIRKIHSWYHSNWSIQSIIRELTRTGVPAPRTSGSGSWTYAIVHGVLTNRRYIGDWAYGVKQSTYLSKKDYIKQTPREEPLARQHFEDRRILDDATFARTQELLALAGRGRSGRKCKDRRSRPRLLNGLFICGKHDRPLTVYGSNGIYMTCPACRMDPEPYLVSMLDRKLALKLVCETVATMISDARLTGPLDVIESCRRHASSMQRPAPAAQAEFEKQEKKLSAGIAFVMANPGETEEDCRESQQKLKELRAERARVQAKLTQIKAESQRPVMIPTEDEVLKAFDHLDHVLNAACLGDEEDAMAAREVIELVTCGRIVLHQAGEARAKHGWLRGVFKADALNPVTKRLDTAGVTAEPREVYIDFRKPAPFEVLADKAKVLYDQGLLLNQIAAELGVRGNLCRKALDHWFTSRDLKRPHGQTRLSTLNVRSVTPPKYQQIAERVMQLCGEGKLLYQIGKEVGVDRNTVTQAVRWWHKSRGLPVPDGRGRRKALTIKTGPPQAA